MFKLTLKVTEYVCDALPFTALIWRSVNTQVFINCYTRDRSVTLWVHMLDKTVFTGKGKNFAFMASSDDCFFDCGAARATSAIAPRWALWGWLSEEKRSSKQAPGKRYVFVTWLNFVRNPITRPPVERADRFKSFGAHFLARSLRFRFVYISIIGAVRTLLALRKSYVSPFVEEAHVSRLPHFFSLDLNHKKIIRRNISACATRYKALSSRLTRLDIDNPDKSAENRSQSRATPNRDAEERCVVASVVLSGCLALHPS